MAVVAALPHGLRRQVRLVRATSPYGVSLQLSGDRTVVWGSPADSAAKLVVLRTLLRHHRAHVYDVSTPGVAVTR
jgi:cell division protein FtsQ